MLIYLFIILAVYRKNVRNFSNNAFRKNILPTLPSILAEVCHRLMAIGSS